VWHGADAQKSGIRTARGFHARKSWSDHIVRSEALRGVYTAITLGTLDHTPRTIAITSAAPGEGKTTFSSRWRAAHQDDRLTSVLIVDLDLRLARWPKRSASRTSVAGRSTVSPGDERLWRMPPRRCGFRRHISAPAPTRPTRRRARNGSHEERAHALMDVTIW